MADRIEIPPSAQPDAFVQSEDKTREILRFPHDYGEFSGQWMVFDEYSYFRPDAESEPEAKETGKSIALPVPPNLATSYQASWEAENFGAMGTAIAHGLADTPESMNRLFRELNAATQEARSAGGAVSSVWETLAQTFPSWDDVKNVALKMGVDAIGSRDIFRRVGTFTGKTVNPFTAAVFTGIGFRQFQFDYKFFPKSFEESQTLHRLIFIFKHGLHPSLSNTYGNNLFDYPNIYQLSLTEPEFLFSFGFCSLRDVNVNYHAEGVPAYFEKDGKKIPASIQLSLSFMEIEINTKETIKDENR